MICVNTIGPGMITTGWLWKGKGVELIERMGKRNLLDHPGLTEDITFLAWPENGWINGQVINVDGGTVLR